MITLRLGHSNSLAVPALAVQWALRHLGTLTSAVTLAEAARIAKMQKSHCVKAGRVKGHEGSGFAVL